MADKSLTIFDRLLDKEKQEEKPETIFDRLLREEREQEEKPKPPTPEAPPSVREHLVEEPEAAPPSRFAQPFPTREITKEDLKPVPAEPYFEERRAKEAAQELKHREKQLSNLDRYREIARKYSDLRERSKAKGSERELKGETDELLREIDEFESASGLGYYDFGLTLKQIKERRVQGSKRQRESAPSKVSPGEEPSWYQKLRRLESTRSLLGPEVGLLDYKPLGSKIDKLGFIPAMFEPVDEGPEIFGVELSPKAIGNYLRIAPKKGRGDAASVGAALWNTAVGLAEVIGGSPGGVATMGLGGALGAAGKTGQAYEAERVLALGESAFAVDLARNAAEHAPGLMRDLEDPDLLGQEKAEALMGEAALLVFSGMSGAKAKKNFKKKYGIEPDKIKTREQARIAYERFLDQTAVERLDPKLRKTPKQVQEAQIEGLISEMQAKVEVGEFEGMQKAAKQSEEQAKLIAKVEKEQGPEAARELRKILEAVESEPPGEALRKGLIEEVKAEEPPTPVEAEVYRSFDVESEGMVKPEIGFHFAATKELADAASIKLGRKDFKTESYIINLKNPVRVKGQENGFRPFSVLEDLVKRKIITEKEFNKAYDEYLKIEETTDLSEFEYWQKSSKLIQDLLKPKGIDGLVYRNEFDAAGITKPADSYIVFDKSSIKKAPKPPTPVEAEFGKSAELEPEAVSSIRDQFRKGAKVYRGTGYKAPADPGDLGSGRYSSSLKERAANYGTRVEELEIKLKNPLILSEGEAYARIADRFGTVTGENRAQAAASAMEAVKAQGYDGIVSVGKDGSWEVVDYAPKPLTKPPLTPLTTPPTEATPRATPEVEALAKELEVNLDGFTKPKGGWTESNQISEEVVRTLGLIKAFAPGELMETGAIKEVTKPKEAKTTPEEVVRGDKEKSDLVTKAVEEAKADKIKIEETITEPALEESLLTEYMKNRKAKKFHKTIRRHMEGADAAEKARWAENPDSAYDVVPTSSWAKAIDKMTLEEIQTDLAKNKDAIPQLGPELIVKSMLENKKAQILKKRWRESKSDADWMEYESFVQELANPKTFAGQYIQAQRHFKAGDPIIEADVIEAAILNHKGPKLSKADRAKLIELIDKSMEAKEKADKAAEEYWKDESDANWEKATKTLDLSEVATINQIEFIANKSPKAVVDMLVATLQGNFLTPTTLMVNVAGNIAPLGPRALARIPARGLDMAEQFFMRDRRIAEREMLIESQKENPSVEVAARIEKLDKMLSPMEQIRLKPIEGTKEKLIGGWEGSGLPRVLEAIKRTREEGGSVKDLLENFRGGKKSTLGMDSAGAIILGEQLNKAMLIEVGEMDMSSMTPSIDAASAAKRLLNTLRRKGGREVEGPESVRAISDLYEVTFGLSPTVFFRALAGGDIPFRNAELRRLIAEQAEIRKWSKEKLGRALERPSLIFNPKEWASLQYRAAQATFQHENRGTRAVQRLNKFLRGESLAGEAAYLSWRSMTPYQKTLININAELLNFTPFGLADVLLTANKDGFMSREAKISAGKVITGTTAMLVAARYLNNDIMSADQDPGMSETGDQRSARYMTEETYHHGFINWDAAMRDMKGEDTAWKPGDYISDARRMGQFGYLLLNGANYHRSLEMMPKEDREKLSSSWNTLLKFIGESVQYSAKYAINQSFATGVRDKLRAVSRAMDADTGSDALKPLAGVLLRDAMTIPVPNTLGWWSKADSPYKQTFKSDELSQALKDEWARKTGMWEEDYPILVDLWGTPLESMPRGTLYPGGLAKHKDTAEGKIDRLDRLMAVSFNIFRFKKSGTIMDPYSSEVYRLWRKFPKGNVVPPIPSPRITLDGVEYKLNRDQYAYYSAMTGRYRLSGTGSIAPSGPTELELSFDKEDGWGVRQFINKGEPFMLDGVRYKNYMDVPDEIKAEEFKKIYRKATTAGKNMFADWEKHKGTPRFDSIMKMYNINPKNLPLTEDQIRKEPSGRAD